QLDQKFVPRRIVLEGKRQPFLQALTACRRDVVLLAPLLAGLADLDQSLRYHLLQRGIDLTVALAPEVPNRCLDRLPDVVPGAVRFNRKHAEDHIGRARASHYLKDISDR